MQNLHSPEFAPNQIAIKRANPAHLHQKNLPAFLTAFVGLHIEKERVVVQAFHLSNSQTLSLQSTRSQTVLALNALDLTECDLD
jgi:hypothetical protein